MTAVDWRAVFQDAYDAGDTARLRPHLADDVVLHTSAAGKPVEGVDAVLAVLDLLLVVFEDLRYTAGFVAEPGTVLLSAGHIAGKRADGVQVISTDTAGRITSMLDFVRPLSALTALSEEAARIWGMAPPPDAAELMRQVYDAYARFDLEAFLALHHPDVVYHVSGRHPLSGDKVGRDDVLAYLLQVAGISGGRGGFEICHLAADGPLGMARVTGTAFHGDREFRRDLVHLARFENGAVVEFWDNPFDQAAEDAFWSTASPAE